MDFQYAFDEYQSSFPSFGMNGLPSDSIPSFIQEPDTLFQQDAMPNVFIPQDYSADSVSFTTETGSPGLPSSTSCSESPAASSPLSSPGDSSVEMKQESFMQQDEMVIDVSSAADVVPKSATIAPERKKKRKQQAEPRPSPKRQSTGKKRRAQSDVCDELNPDYLVQMSSVELETMYQQLYSEGRLKADDDKLFKKIIRQVKNRESAQTSRTRRRDYMEYIEAKLKHEEVVSSCLRDYANQLKDLLVQNGVEVPPEPEMPVFVPPPPSEVTSKAIMRPLRTAGICLMLVVLSVGIVFNAMHHSHPSRNISTVSNTSDSTGMVSEPAAAVDPSARVIVEGSASMDQLSKAQESNSEIAPSLRSSPRPSEPQRHNGEVASLDVIRKSAYLSYDTDKADSSVSALIIPDQKQQVPPSSSVSTLIPASCPVMRYTTKAIFGDAEPHVVDDSWTFDNTSYILVNDAAEFVPRRVYTSSLQARTEPVIGLILPASSFNISNTAPGDVVELICGVKNANVVPRSVVAHSLF